MKKFVWVYFSNLLGDLVKKAAAEERKGLQAQITASVAETENLKEENQGEQGYRFTIRRKCRNNESRLRKQKM